MKTSATILVVILTASLLGLGCSKETVDPYLTGDIEGKVLNGDTGKPVPAASVTTNPGTDAVLTDQNGQFSIQGVSTGNYTVQVKKDSFFTESVRISVKENRVANAQILLKRDDGDVSTDKNIRAEVTFFENFNYGPRDSIYVNVEYRFENMSSTDRVGKYEVYFKIDTADSSFYHEVQGDSLAAGEQTPGTFKKYIYQFNAQSVTVSGIYAQNL